MRIEIDIPKEFEGDYNANKFKDFFGRVIADATNNDGCCGLYELETAEMLRKAFAESKLAYDVEAVIKELGKDEICSRCLNSHNPVSVCAEFCDLGKKLEFIRNGKKE